jgi:membrane protein DedA with SNARE-associated domain
MNLMGSYMVQWTNDLMTSLGYWGIGLLMFLENLFPPIPSELIMPLAGFTVSQGRMNFGLAVLAGTVGTMAGTFAWYYLGRVVNYQRLETWANRYGKWIGVTVIEIDRVNNWFNKHGNKAVFFGRMVPGIRTLISLPAGMNKMPIGSFTLYSTMGTLIWTLALTTAGFLLGDNYAMIEQYLAPVSKIILFGLVGLMGYWLFRKFR